MMQTGILQKSLQIQFLTMQVVFDEQNHHVVLFKLTPGTAAASYGVNHPLE